MLDISGKAECFEICDPEVREYYARFEKGALRFYNASVGDESHILAYDPTEIEDIREGLPKEILVTMKNGIVHRHKATFKTEPPVAELSRIDFAKPGYNGIMAVLLKEKPEIREYLYMDETSDKIVADLSIIGMDG